MYKTIRKKIASSVSEIEKTEDFAWGKWLKEPVVREHIIEGFESSLFDTDPYNSWLEKPSFKKKNFDFRDTFIFPENKNLHLKKSKTNTVFFGISKTEIKKLNLFDKEYKFEHKPEKVNFESISAKLKEVKWDLPHPKVEQKLWELISKVLKIDLLKSNPLSSDNCEKNELKIELYVIKSPPKIYKVKVTSLDKIKVTKIYYLKNISLHDVRILRESLSLITKPLIEIGDLKYILTEEEKHQEALPEKYLTKENNPVDLIEDIKAEEITDKDFELKIVELLSDDISFDENITEEEIHQEEEYEEKIEYPDSETIPGDEEENIELHEATEQADLKEPGFQNIVSDEIITEEKKQKYIEETKETESEEFEEPEEVKEDDCETKFESLYYFQEEGAEFLLDNKRAVLLDDLGMGKSNQVIAALKNHFANKKIKSAVIVCEQNETGSWGIIPDDIDGWLGHFHQRAPELKAETANKSSSERKKQWKNLPDVLIISYDSFFLDFEEDLIDSNEIKKNVCLVFDEVQTVFTHKTSTKQQFAKIINPKFLWATSSYPEADIKEKLDKVFREKQSIKNYLVRSRKDVESDLPGITWQNKWLTLDEDQLDEYNEAFATAKEKVQWFLESGNPLRFNANVFTLVHQLKQVCNFSEKKGKSRKTNLLIEQVMRISKKQQKVVIFSQYDKAGTKKIEEILKNNNIRFLSYAPGMSTKEMESVLKNFSSSSSVTALVAGVKPSRVKIPPGNVSYVIHFDLWWNPASLWQTEEAITGSSKSGERPNLNVFSYLMKNTVEERIHSLLYKKGFLNKHIMETVNPDTIAEMITNPEWLEIFDMPDEEYKQKYQKGLLETEKRIDSYSTIEFMERGKNFFAKLGYKNLDASENKAGNSFDLRGIYKKAKHDQQMCARFLLKNATEEEVKTHLSELKTITNSGKFFLISKGSFESDETIRTHELIDRDLLVNYFYQFIII